MTGQWTPRYQSPIRTDTRCLGLAGDATNSPALVRRCLVGGEFCAGICVHTTCIRYFCHTRDVHMVPRTLPFRAVTSHGALTRVDRVDRPELGVSDRCECDNGGELADHIVQWYAVCTSALPRHRQFVAPRCRLRCCIIWDLTQLRERIHLEQRPTADQRMHPASITLISTWLRD